MSTLLVKNGTVVTATDTYTADIYCEGETIHTIGKNLNLKADKTIDAQGCYVFPGGIDPHTHMELPFMGTHSSDTFESGTLAGLHGGTTTIIDFAIQTQGNTLGHALNQWHEKADGHAVGDYAFHMAVTDFNDNTRAEVKDVVSKHGINSFKTFMAYKGALMIDDRQMLGLMDEVKKHGGFVTAHAENGDMVAKGVEDCLAAGQTDPKYHARSRPPLCEEEAVSRFVDMAASGKHPVYIVHMSCEEALNRVRAATARNQKVYVETCIQYLILDDSLYNQDGFEGAKFVLSPPLRTKKDQEALWAGISQNLVHTIATDHCPFCMDQKAMGKDDFSKIPNGLPGIEHRIELLFSEGVEKGRISLNKFVDLSSTASAKIFGLFPKKGTLAVGSDADLVVFDPTAKHTLSSKTHHMNCDYSAFEGWQVTGKCRTTILRGNVAVDEGEAKIGKGFGKYLPRKPITLNA
jgi:dihydropyrimidinase